MCLYFIRTKFIRPLAQHRSARKLSFHVCCSVWARHYSRVNDIILLQFCRICLVEFTVSEGGYQSDHLKRRFNPINYDSFEQIKCSSYMTIYYIFVKITFCAYAIPKKTKHEKDKFNPGWMSHKYRQSIRSMSLEPDTAAGLHPRLSSANVHPPMSRLIAHLDYRSRHDALNMTSSIKWIYSQTAYVRDDFSIFSDTCAADLDDVQCGAKKDLKLESVRWGVLVYTTTMTSLSSHHHL